MILVSPVDMQVTSDQIVGRMGLNEGGGWEDVITGNNDGEKMVTHLRSLMSALSPSFMPMEQVLTITSAAPPTTTSNTDEPGMLCYYALHLRSLIFYQYSFCRIRWWS
jgi:hypothetical protein